MIGHGGFQPISPEKHVLTFLWFVGHEAASFRDVADRFDVSLSALHSIVKRMSMFISGMAKKVIKDPTEDEKGATKTFYLNREGFPDIIGEYI
jgi:hypothetical protein